MMRISTGMIFDQGVRAINSQTASLLHLQQQVAAGRRLVSPADDPVNAARALVVNQSVDVTTQFATNQDNAKSVLGLEESHLTGVTELMGRLKELAVHAGNGSLSANDRASIATELRARFDELLGIANATDGNGEFIFSGYMSKTKPFAASPDAYIQNAAATEGSLYGGDSGQRRLQVSPTRFLEVSDAGNDVFMRIKNGNGYFATTYAAGNTGSGVIDTGSVTNPAAWTVPVSGAYSIQFSVAAGVTSYRVFDGAAPVTALTPYVSGQPITFNGASVTVTGAPANNDSFTLTPSSSQSLFRTLAGLIGALEGNATGAAGAAKYAVDIGNAIGNLDRANDNILRVRAAIGSRLHELDTLSSVNKDLGLQYQQTLSGLQDLDYAKTISDLTRKQTDLEAAQKSFVSTSKLSLFNYL